MARCELSRLARPAGWVKCSIFLASVGVEDPVTLGDKGLVKDAMAERTCAVVRISVVQHRGWSMASCLRTAAQGLCPAVVRAALPVLAAQIFVIITFTPTKSQPCELRQLSLHCICTEIELCISSTTTAYHASITTNTNITTGASFY